MNIKKAYDMQKQIKNLDSITIEGNLIKLSPNNKYNIIYDVETIMKHGYYKGNTEEYSKDIIKKDSSQNPWINKVDTYSKLFKVKSKNIDLLYNYIPGTNIGIVTRIGKLIKQISGIDKGDIILLSAYKIAIKNSPVDVNNYKKSETKFRTTINDQSIFMVIKQNKEYLGRIM